MTDQGSIFSGTYDNKLQQQSTLSTSSLFCVVSTSRPISGNTTSGTNGGGNSSNTTNGCCMCIIDPYTGSIHSSTRVCADGASGKQPIGLSSLSILHDTKNNHTLSSSSSSPLAEHCHNNYGISLAFGYGTNCCKDTITNTQNQQQQHINNNNSDTYGMFFTIRSATRNNTATASPTSVNIQWKCRLPEPNMSGGILISPCGHYVIGGGQSGSIYIWNILRDGLLVRVIDNAHYRPITVLKFTIVNNTSTMLITGGADGIVHVYTLLDLVEEQTNNAKGVVIKPITPIRTWSKHNLLPITSIVSLTGTDSNRLVSAGEDGTIHLLEIFSGLVLATIRMPSIIRCLSIPTSFNNTNSVRNRLYAGSSTGIIYIIDLDDYAIFNSIQTQNNGTAVVIRPNKSTIDTTSLSTIDSVLGTGAAGMNNIRTNNRYGNDDQQQQKQHWYRNELRGHDSSVTSIVEINQSSKLNNTSNGGILLVSGDTNGTIRIWDLSSMGCIRIIRPWATTSISTSIETSSINDTSNDKTKSIVGTTPITAIDIIHVENDIHNNNNGSNMFGQVLKRKHNSMSNKDSILNTITPFQRYVTSASTTNAPGSNEHGMKNVITVPFLRSIPFKSLSSSTSSCSSSLWDLSQTGFSIEDALQFLQSQTKQQRFNTINDRNASIKVEQQQQISNAVESMEDVSETSNETNDDIAVVDPRKKMNDENDATILQLRKELEDAQTTIKRWENVNNQLLDRLKKQQQ